MLLIIVSNFIHVILCPILISETRQIAVRGYVGSRFILRRQMEVTIQRVLLLQY